MYFLQVPAPFSGFRGLEMYLARVEMQDVQEKFVENFGLCYGDAFPNSEMPWKCFGPF